MYSREYKKTFILRFSGYFLTLCGLTATIFQFGPVAKVELSYRFDQLMQIHYKLASQYDNQFQTQSVINSTSFGQLRTQTGDIIYPVSTGFGIVIEKINANSKIIPDVDPADQAQYTAALAQGVAEAKGSTEPGQPGNLYLFSHSVDAPWNVARYNAVFYLLRELNPGDKINIFYHGRRYLYIVFDKTIVKPTDLSFLVDRYNIPVLTLQTCDPPGTLLNRLIVRAKLIGT